MTDYTATIANLITGAARHVRRAHFYRTATTLQRLNSGLGKLTRRKDLQALALKNLGRIAWSAGNLEQARRFHTDALSLERKAGRTHGIIDNLTDLGTIAAKQHAWEEARENHFEACEIARALGELEEVADQQSYLGDNAASADDIPTALDHYQEAQKLYGELGLEEDARNIATNISKLETGEKG